MTEKAKLQIEVREALPADIEDIVEIWWQLASEHVDRDSEFWRLIPEHEARSSFQEYANELFGTPDHVLLVAEIQGQVAGFIHGSIRTRPPVMKLVTIGRIDEVSVHKDFRGQGVGRKILIAILDELKERGLSHVELMVDVDNPAAINLYKSAGFCNRQSQMVKKL